MILTSRAGRCSSWLDSARVNWLTRTTSWARSVSVEYGGGGATLVDMFEQMRWVYKAKTGHF